MLAEDRDPGVQKKLDKIAAETLARTTFKLIAEEHLDNMKDRDLASTTITKNAWLLMKLAEPLHKRPISEISPAEVLYLLQGVERSGRREPEHRDALQIWRLRDEDTFKTPSERAGPLLTATHRSSREGRLIPQAGTARPEPGGLG